MVAGRTMLREDGGVDVIIDGNYLAESDGKGGYKRTAAGLPTVNPVSLEILRRTVAHEAQHAVMDQAGSGFAGYQIDKVPGGPAARSRFQVARKMCDEHRAQWNAAQVMGARPPSIGDVLDTLCHLGEALAAADARYQQASHAPISVVRLRDDVYTGLVRHFGHGSPTGPLNTGRATTSARCPTLSPD